TSGRPVRFCLRGVTCGVRVTSVGATSLGDEAHVEIRTLPGLSAPDLGGEAVPTRGRVLDDGEIDRPSRGDGVADGGRQVHGTPLWGIAHVCGADLLADGRSGPPGDGPLVEGPGQPVDVEVDLRALAVGDVRVEIQR